jgi:hypothetical protein
MCFVRIVVPETHDVKRAAIRVLQVALVFGDAHESMMLALHDLERSRLALRRAFPVTNVHNVSPCARLRGREAHHPERGPARWIVESPDLPYPPRGRRKFRPKIQLSRVIRVLEGCLQVHAEF